MRRMKGNRGLWALAAAAAGVIALAQAAAAADDVSTEVPGSIVVYPKVISDSSHDTIIELTNTSNMLVNAHCFFVNAGVPGEWTETDFDVFLTKQQPTHFTASSGRVDIGSDSNINNDGLSPGLIPPVPPGFVGELICVQVDETGVPFVGNALTGMATIQQSNGSTSNYNAVAFQGNPQNPPAGQPNPNDLMLTLTPNTDSITGNNTGEFSACPDTLLLNFVTDGVNDEVISSIGDCDDKACVNPNGTVATPLTSCTTNGDCATGQSCNAVCPVNTSLTLVPCSADFETLTPGMVTVQFQVFDEFERAFSASTTVSCFLSTPLSAINSVFTPRVLDTFSGHARITPNPGEGGVIGIAEEFRQPDPFGNTGGVHTTSSAYNIEVEGNRFDAATDGKGNPVAGATDQIVIPAE